MIVTITQNSTTYTGTLHSIIKQGSIHYCIGGVQRDIPGDGYYVVLIDSNGKRIDDIRVHHLSEIKEVDT